MPDVSVHIVTYNSAEYIRHCLAGLRQQEGVTFSTLVIDNASSDDTLARVQAAGVPFVANTSNIGYGPAHNQAIDTTQDTTRSDYVLTLNPDVWLEPGFLRHMVAALEADPGLGSAAGCLLRVEDLDDAPQTVDGAGLYMRRSRRQGLYAEGVSILQRPTTPAPIFGPDGAAAFYRRAMLDDIRLNGEVFDSAFFMHKEDVDLCWRAQLRGWRSVYVPEAVGHHVRGFRPGQRGRVTGALRFYAVRNRYLLMYKNEIAGHFLRDLLPILAYELAIFGYILLKERQSLRAYADVWAQRRSLREKRRLIQAGRKVNSSEIRAAFSRPALK